MCVFFCVCAERAHTGSGMTWKDISHCGWWLESLAVPWMGHVALSCLCGGWRGLPGTATPLGHRKGLSLAWVTDLLGSFQLCGPHSRIQQGCNSPVNRMWLFQLLQVGYVHK